jgi:hypothetical protein
VTEDATNQIDWTTREIDQSEWSETMVIDLMEIKFTDPFDTVTEGVPSLDYWSTYEVVDPYLYLLCAIVVHIYVGGWDISLAKRECLFL